MNVLTYILTPLFQNHTITIFIDTVSLSTHNFPQEKLIEMPHRSTSFKLIMSNHPSNSEKGLRAPRLEPVPLPAVEEDYDDENLWQSILRNDCYTFLPLLIFDNNSPTLEPPLPKQLRRLSISGGENTISSHPRKISFSSFPPPTASISSPVANSHRRPSYVTGTIG